MVLFLPTKISTLVKSTVLTDINNLKFIHPFFFLISHAILLIVILNIIQHGFTPLFGKKYFTFVLTTHMISTSLLSCLRLFIQCFMEMYEYIYFLKKYRLLKITILYCEYTYFCTFGLYFMYYVNINYKYDNIKDLLIKFVCLFALFNINLLYYFVIKNFSKNRLKMLGENNDNNDIISRITLSIIKILESSNDEKISGEFLSFLQYTIKYVEEKSEECTVCLENFDSDDTVFRSECSHVFHSQCIIKWIINKSSCPICRKHIIMTI